MKKISFCTTCRGRLQHIKETLPRSVAACESLTGLVEINVVDYNCPDGTADWISDNLSQHVDSGLVNVYRTTEPSYFWMAHAKNVAHRVAQGEFLYNLDADNYVEPGLVEKILQIIDKDKDVLVLGPELPTVWGRVCLSSQHFHYLGGYDEDTKGYGFEDVDLTIRAYRHLKLKKHFLWDFKGCFEHSDASRFEHLDPALDWAPEKSPQGLDTPELRDAYLKKNKEYPLGISWRRNFTMCFAKYERNEYIANVGREWGQATLTKNNREDVRV